MIDRLLRDKLVDAYIGLIPLVTLNLIWLLTSLPLVTLIPSSGALLYATHQLAHGKPATWSTFWEGFRLCARKPWAWGWGLLNLVVIAALVSNFLFYARGDRNSNATILALAVVIVLAFLWVAVQVSTFPLLLEQEKPSLRLALRNSLVILIKRPFYTLGVALVIAVSAIVTTVIIQPAWFFITAGFCAYFANRATVHSIAAITGKPLPAASIEG